MQRRHEWFDREEFWRELYPYMFPKERFEAAADEVDKVVALSGVTRGSVLDLCCGPGRHAVELARRGFRVTGVDTTPFLLDKAKQRARRARTKVEWVRSDMRDFERPGEFDLVLNMFTAFGYFDDKGEDRRVLASVRASLKPLGVFVLDLMGKERLARIFLETSSERFDDGALLVQRRSVFDNWTRVRNEWMLVRKGKAVTHTFHHTVYSAQELVELLLAAGFADVKAHGDLDGSEYGVDARRLVMVARAGATRSGGRP